jgi:hypothetical protein
MKSEGSALSVVKMQFAGLPLSLHLHREVTTPRLHLEAVCTDVGLAVELLEPVISLLLVKA